MFILDNLNNIVDSFSIESLRTFLKTSPWNYKLPGGFGHHFPQRKVNTYGDGRYITDSGTLKGSYWKST